jgi:hypothetical protein
MASTKPIGEWREAYHELTKGELFHTAMSYFQHLHPDKALDMKEFKKFCKHEMSLYKGLTEGA